MNTTTRSIGQVIFLNSSKSGSVILGSLFIADPTLAAFATLGAATSVATANILKLDETWTKDGLHGYNGALIGCASTVFATSLPFVTLGTLAGAVTTPVLSASLRNVSTVPQWTFSFNFVMLSSLMKTRPLLVDSDSPMVESAVEKASSFTDVLTSPLTSLSQIFVVDSSLSGAGILAATSLYSPGLALHALGGGLTGCLVGLLLGDVSDVTAGLWGYNSALTSMAIGAFYVDSDRARVLSCGAAAGTAVLFGGMSTVMGSYGVPCLTLPFCSMATGEFGNDIDQAFIHCISRAPSSAFTVCYHLEGQIPGLKLAKAPHSPEKNV